MERLSSPQIWEPIFNLPGSMLSWPPVGIALFWFAALMVLWLIYRGIKSTARTITAFFYTSVHRLRTRLANIKTWIVCKLRSVAPHRRASGVTQGPVLEFDENELAVLRLAAAQGPGQIVSAKDFAERLSMRPRQVQRHLDQLGNAKIMESVVGSTGGFANYRLTAYGTAFLANISRQAPSGNS